MYQCRYVCSRHTGFGARATVDRERHPVAFPDPRPVCMVCDQPMTLASYLLVEGEKNHRPVRKVVRRAITKGSLSLFPEYSA